MRREGQVVVGPLAEDGHQVGVERVILHHFYACPKDPVGHLPDLRMGRRQPEMKNHSSKCSGNAGVFSFF